MTWIDDDGIEYFDGCEGQGCGEPGRGYCMFCRYDPEW